MWRHSINVKVAEKVPEKQLFFTKNLRSNHLQEEKNHL